MRNINILQLISKWYFALFVVVIIFVAAKYFSFLEPHIVEHHNIVVTGNSYITLLENKADKKFTQMDIILDFGEIQKLNNLSLILHFQDSDVRNVLWQCQSITPIINTNDYGHKTITFLTPHDLIWAKSYLYRVALLGEGNNLVINKATIVLK